MIVNKSLYPVSSTLRTITAMQRQMEDLQTQLATGKRYNTLAEFGSERIHDLNIRGRLNRIEGYQSNIQTVETRLSFYTNGLQRLDEIEADARALAVPGAYGNDGVNLVNARQQAENGLREVIDILNTDITGQYIFGGSASDKKPVASFDDIMKGPNGFEQYVVDANLADTGNMGRIDHGTTGNSVNLTEDGDHRNGLKLISVNASNSTASNVSATPANPVDVSVPRTLTMTFDSQPKEGDTITIGVTYPHDRDKVEYMTFTATESDPAPDGSFTIGADVATTAENLHEAITGTLDEVSATKLHSSSTYAAADRFFNGIGEPQDDDTVQWYNGQDGNNARQTVTANIDESTKVHYGVQANEHGLVELMKGLAVFAVSDFTPLNEGNAARYEGMVEIQRGRLSENNNAKPGSIEGITMELGLASSTLNNVKARHTQYNAQLSNMLADIEAAPVEEVAMQMLTLQTRLQASYQVTSMVSQLSLVNYLR